jgi:hypothetical protein
MALPISKTRGRSNFLPGLLLAIGALGPGTSLAAIRRLGWRHAANIVGTVLAILIVVTAGLAFCVEEI